MQSDFGKLTEDWRGIDTIVLYGLGKVADRFIDKFLSDFTVPYIIDLKKSGTSYRDITIITVDEAMRRYAEKKEKIVVLTSLSNYLDIKAVLEGRGLKEYRDFCKAERFAVEWYEDNKGQFNIAELHSAVTTWCSLNCEKCNMFMPYYKDSDRRHYTFEEIKEDMDVVMSYADYVFRYMFLGGEPFLNKELKDIISYAGENYKGRIGRIAITTNGTIMPDDNTLEQLSKHNVEVSISDYSKAIGYEDKILKLIEVLEKWNIKYERNVMDEWKDFGFPENPFHWGIGQVEEHMHCCAPVFHGINEKRLYYCHIIWSAEKAGLYTVPKQDYIDLQQLNPNNVEDRRRVIHYCEGQCERGFMGLCMLCGGCGTDNDKIIKAGEQKNR